jgi:hypothetical protein
MTMTATMERKYRLIQLIMSVDNDEILSSIEDTIAKSQKPSPSPKPSFWDAVKPIRKGVPFEQLLAEQGYKPLTYEAFRSKADEVDMQESVEELLALLTK